MSVPANYDEWMEKARNLSSTLSIIDQIATMRDLIKGLPLTGMPHAVTTASFIQPEVGSSVDVPIAPGDWLQPFVVLAVGGEADDEWVGGLFIVESVGDLDEDGAAIASLKRLSTGEAYPTGATAGTEIPEGARCTVSAYVPDASSTSAISPSNVQAQIIDGVVTVSWGEVEDLTKCDDISVFWGPGEGAGGATVDGFVIHIPATDISASIKLPAFGHYWFTVKGRLNGRYGAASTGCPIWIEYAAPAIISGVSAVLTGNTLVIGWDELDDDTGFVIVEYWEDASAYRHRIAVPAGSTNVSIILPSSGTWHYRLAPQDANGVVGSFTEASSEVFAGIEAPSGALFEIATGGTIICAEWTNASATDEVVLEWGMSDTEGGTISDSGTIRALSRNGRTSAVLPIPYPGAWYFLRLWNVVGGVWSPVGAPAEGEWIRVPPCEIASNSVSVSGASATFSWTLNSGAEADLIYVNVSPTALPEGELTMPVTSAVASGHANTLEMVIGSAGTYNYTIVAKSKIGGVETATDSATFTVQGPTSVSGVASSWSDSITTLTWNTLVADPDVFQIEIQLDPTGAASESLFSTIAYVPKSDQSFDYAQLSGTSYAYRLRTLDLHGNHSNWTSVTVTR